MSDSSKYVTCLSLVAFLAVVLAPGEACAPSTEPIQYGRGHKLCELANAAITESSGLACSRLKPGIFWTHNDSGDLARLFAFNTQGENLATYEVSDAEAIDWEDMASFQLDDQSVLLIADVGDNNRRRGTCTLYVINEPELDADQRDATGTVEPTLTIRFRYEDGRHNCESVAVDPTTKAIFLVTKAGRRKCTVYRLPWPEAPSAEPLVATAVATLKLPPVTAADISPDGLRAIVLTYGAAYEYSKKPDEEWVEAFSRDPRIVRMPMRIQGESICYGQDGKTLYLTSEKRPTPLLEVPVVQPESAGD